ncbi:MAG: hypothetical protein HS114_37645 [Anaerolineales bacterium]|nr:hypothetical protein [Anaerolineales bacterium]
MRVLSCSAKMTLTLVDLPRSHYRLLPPRRWQVALTLAGIVSHALTEAVLDLPKTLLKTMLKTMPKIQPAYFPAYGGG